ncbi:hypothetical protein [Roseovarius rhodophyticola]|uniref:Uncharacterized protein n=1 Tax=Roseovarius rhodophyticola TaxID=3080827 RepID=A0ABZ2TDI3_9RHOB|nr:hypothetical protein [Roseovarius sp. W115]MDV2927986.1 hypothetical protein [Roseovarius sp. W115]
MNEDLDAQMIAAHEAGDLRALVTLYTAAADAANDMDTACFFLTHAYVFALEAGADEACKLRARLKAEGRES